MTTVLSSFNAPRSGDFLGFINSDRFFFLLCGDHPAKQNGKKATSKVASTLQFVHANDHASREAELKKKRVSPLPWRRVKAWLNCQVHRHGKWKVKGQNG